MSTSMSARSLDSRMISASENEPAACECDAKPTTSKATASDPTSVFNIARPPHVVRRQLLGPRPFPPPRVLLMRRRARKRINLPDQPVLHLEKFHRQAKN